eukprot:246159_1
MAQSAQQYHFEIAVIDENEALDEIVCGLNIFDLKREIQQNVIPYSKYYLPLEIGTIGWHLCFEVRQNKHIIVKSNDELKNAVYENATRRNFKLLVKFKDEQKYNMLKEQQVQVAKGNTIRNRNRFNVSTPSIQRIDACNGYFQCYIQYPSDTIHKIQYMIEYQIKRVTSSNKKRSKATQEKPQNRASTNENKNQTDDRIPKDNKTHHPLPREQQHSLTETVYRAPKSPFMIRHYIWPNQKYKFRVRLVSKLFPAQKSNWTKWSSRYAALAPSINDITNLNDKNDQSKGSKSKTHEFEHYNHNDLCKWIHAKLYQTNNNNINKKQVSMTRTPFEQKEIFPVLYACIEALTALCGVDFIYKKAEEYIRDLMDIYANDSKALPQKKGKAKAKNDYGDRNLENKKTQIVSLLHKKIPAIISSKKLDDHDFIHLLRDAEVQKVLSGSGIDHKQLLNKFQDKMRSSKHKAQRFTKHDFLSILYRLRQCALSELSLPICSNPYCIYIWTYFIKEPTQKYSLRLQNTDAQHKILRTSDHHEVPLQPALSVAQCTLYFGIYYVRQYAQWSDLYVNLYCGGNVVVVDQEAVTMNSNKSSHLIVKFNNNNSNKTVDKCRMLSNWNNLYVSRKILGSGINLPYFDCMMKFVFSFVGKCLPFNEAVNVFTMLWKSHQKSTKHKQELHQLLEDHMIKYKHKNALHRLDISNKEYDWLNLTAVLFRMYWIMGSQTLMNNSNLFDSDMICVDIAQEMLSGDYGPIQRVTSLLASLYHDLPKENAFVDRIIKSIEIASKDYHQQHLFVLWYNFIDCMVYRGQATRFGMKYTGVHNLMEARSQRFTVDGLFLRLIQVDVCIELITKNAGVLDPQQKRCMPMEKQAFWILSELLILSQDNPSHCQECLRKSNGVLAIFNPNYSEVMVANQGKLNLILNQQRYPFHSMLSMYKVLKPTHTDDLTVFAQYMARFVDEFHLIKASSSSANHIVRYFHNILSEDQVIARNATLLNAILNNDSLCWREEFIPYVVTMLSKDIDRLKKVYRLYWVNRGLLATIKDLIVVNSLPKDPLCEIMNEESTKKDLISSIPFKAWLEIIAHRECTNEMKLILAGFPPLTFAKMRGSERRILINFLVASDPQMFPESHKPLVYHGKSVVAHKMMENIMALSPKFYNPQDQNFANPAFQDVYCDTIKFFGGGLGSACIKFCYEILSYQYGEEIQYCKELFSHFKSWWQKLRIDFANAGLPESLMSILERGLYDSISDLFVHVGGEPDFLLDDKIRTVIEQYQTKIAIASALNLFFNHFVPPDTINWGQGLKRLNEKWHYVEQLTTQKMLKEEWKWYTPYRTFLEKLTQNPESYVFKKIWKDRFAFYKERWDKGLKFSEMGCLDTCLWMEHIMENNTRQYVAAIEELQTHFMNGAVTGKHLEAVKDYTHADIVMEFCKQIQLKLNTTNHKLYKEILERLLFPIKIDEFTASTTNILDTNQTAAVDGGKDAGNLNWNRSYSVNILKLLFENDVEPFWSERICHGIKNNDIGVYYIERYFNVNDRKRMYKEIKYMKIYKSKDTKQQITAKTEEITKCLKNLALLKKVKLIHHVLGMFKTILQNELIGPEAEWLVLTRELTRLRFPLTQQSELSFRKLMDFSKKNARHLSNIHISMEGMQWLNIINQNEQFVSELFEHFRDDVKFANHIKLFQNPDPEHQKSLLGLHNIRKLLVKDIGAKFKGLNMFQARKYLCDTVLKNMKDKTIKAMERLIEDWVDIKGDVTALASLQFNRDRSFLKRLKAFKFKKCELLIELYPREEHELENDDMFEDEKESQETLLTTQNSTTSRQMARKLQFLADTKTNGGDENKPNIMRVEEFESLHDRLLIYTSSTNATPIPHLIKKQVNQWSNEEVLQFFDNELNSSARTIIDSKESEMILKIMRDREISGSDLFEKHLAFKKFCDLFGDLGGDDTRKDIVLMELLKIIQIQLMKAKVNDIVPKFDIAKTIQKLRRMYFDQGGKDRNTKYNVCEIFNVSIAKFEQILIRWKFYLFQWRHLISKLRDRYPLLGFFTVSDMRFICQEYTQYKTISGMALARDAKVPKLTAKFAFIDRDITYNDTEKLIGEWGPLEDTIYSKELELLLRNKFNTKFRKNRYAKLKKLIRYINLYLETQEFRKWFNTEYFSSLSSADSPDIAFDAELEDNMRIIEEIMDSKPNTIALLKLVTPFDERKKFGLLGEYLTRAFSKGPSGSKHAVCHTGSFHFKKPNRQVSQISLGISEGGSSFPATDDETEHDMKISDKDSSRSKEKDKMQGYLSAGITLYHTDSSDLVLSRVIKLFSHVNQPPHASQILICSRDTTFEDLNCFLHRCCYHDEDDLLYCLIQPENLPSNVTDEILKILFQQLRSASRAFFTVITADRKSKWFSYLQIYSDVLDPLTDMQREEFYTKYICTDFDAFKNGKMVEINNIAKSIQNENPLCMVFLSDEECVGKSYEITKECKKNHFVMIHVPFNSPKVDKDFVVDRLTRPDVQRAQKNNQKIVFHLNVSSHAGKDINTLMFQLLILRHITKSTGESFAVRPNHAFFIELPSQISKTYKKTNIDDVCSYFYFVAGRRSFVPRRKIKMDLKRFDFTTQHQFVLKYLDALDRDLLEIKGGSTKQWAFDEHKRIQFDRAIELVHKYSNFRTVPPTTQKQRSRLKTTQIVSPKNVPHKQVITIVYLRSFLDFLYRQFVQLAGSYVLINQDVAQDVAGKWRKKRYIQYHTVIALSFARMAKYFACSKYEILNPLLNQAQHEATNSNSLYMSARQINEEEIKIGDSPLLDLSDVDEKGNDMILLRQGSEISQQKDETRGNETFSLVNEWSQADPPIVFLNASHIVSITKPTLKTDLQFELENGEQSFTLLCSNLDDCKHAHSEEWKYFQKIMTEPSMEKLKWDLYNFKQEDEIRRQNVQKGKLHADSVEKQKIKLRLILKLCGGYKRYDKGKEKMVPIRDEVKRGQLVDDLYEKNKGYALTFDNILKIVAIFFRVKSGIPVLIMGETGCGKTKLLEYMANVLHLDMQSVDVHGGYNIHDLTRDINEAAEKAMNNKQQTVLLFLDEINTSEEIASFKEIICDHCFKGEHLPENLITIGALNPYRRRKKSDVQREQEVQDKQNNKTFYNNDFERDMSKLVYTVYPLPPSMKYFVWNFGYIHPI